MEAGRETFERVADGIHRQRRTTPRYSRQPISARTSARTGRRTIQANTAVPRMPTICWKSTGSRATGSSASIWRPATVPCRWTCPRRPPEASPGGSSTIRTSEGGRNKEQCWTLAQRLLSEVDLDCSDEWHEYWGENAPLLEDSADLAEAEQAETDRIRSEQMRAAAKRIAAGMPEPGGEIHVDSYRKADGTVVRGYTSETFALKAACNPLADD